MARDFLLLSKSYGEKKGSAKQSLHVKLAIVQFLDESYSIRNFSVKKIIEELEKRNITIGKTGISKISTLYKTVFEFLSAKPETVEKIGEWRINKKILNNQKSIISIIDCFMKDGIQTWQDVKGLWEKEDGKREKENEKSPDKKPEEISEIISLSQLPENSDNIRELAEKLQEEMDRCHRQNYNHLTYLCELYSKALTDIKGEFAELADDYQRILGKCAGQETTISRIRKKMPETCKKLLAEIRKSRKEKGYLEIALKEEKARLKKAADDIGAYEALLSEAEQKNIILQEKNRRLEKVLIAIRNQFSQKMEGFLKEVFGINDDMTSLPEKTELSDLSLPSVCSGINGQSDMKIVYSDEFRKRFSGLPAEIRKKTVDKIPDILLQGKSGNRTKKHETKGEDFFHSRINSSYRIKWKFEFGNVHVSTIYNKKDV